MNKPAQILCALTLAFGLLHSYAPTLILGAAYGQANENPTPDLPLEAKPAPKKAKPGSFKQKAKTPELAKDLDGLFVQLKRTRDTKQAGRISKRIRGEWQTSDSKSVDLLTGWARAAVDKRQFGQAMDLLDQVVVLRPEYAEGYNQRATLHFMMKNYGKSVADIERTLALEPRHYGALSGLAAILEILNQKKNALSTWYRALEVYPAMTSAQNAVARLEEELAGSGI